MITFYLYEFTRIFFIFKQKSLLYRPLNEHIVILLFFFGLGRSCSTIGTKYDCSRNGIKPKSRRPLFNMIVKALSVTVFHHKKKKKRNTLFSPSCRICDLDRSNRKIKYYIII